LIASIVLNLAVILVSLRRGS